MGVESSKVALKRTQKYTPKHTQLAIGANIPSEANALRGPDMPMIAIRANRKRNEEFQDSIVSSQRKLLLSCTFHCPN